MQASTLQENVVRALVRTGRTVSSRPQIPIVQNVLIQTKEGRLQVAATNLETTEVVWVGAKVEKEGGICVPAKTLTEFVLTLPAETIRLSVKESTLFVQCAGFRASIPGLPAKEFPPTPAVSTTGALGLEKTAIVRALGLVLFAAAEDEGRPILTGVRIKTEGEKTQFVATDGYRLSLKEVSLKTREPLDMVVPARALAEVVKVGQEEKEVTEVFFAKIQEGGQLGCVVGDTEVSTRLIDGEYPNTAAIIPSVHTTRILLDRDALGRAVKSAAVFARDNANVVRFVIRGQTLTIGGSSAQAGENQVELDVKVDGEDGEIAFNSRFLVELLANVQEPELLFEMTGSLNPGVFKPVKDDSFLHIIMPVRTAST